MDDVDLAGERRELARYLDWRDGTRGALVPCEVCGTPTFAPSMCATCQHGSPAVRAAQRGVTP